MMHLKQIIKKHKPTKGKGTKYPYIYELKQVDSDPPVFSVRIGAKDSLNRNWYRVKMKSRASLQAIDNEENRPQDTFRSF